MTLRASWSRGSGWAFCLMVTHIKLRGDRPPEMNRKSLTFPEGIPYVPSRLPTVGPWVVYCRIMQEVPAQEQDPSAELVAGLRLGPLSDGDTHHSMDYDHLIKSQL